MERMNAGDRGRITMDRSNGFVNNVRRFRRWAAQRRWRAGLVALVAWAGILALTRPAPHAPLGACADAEERLTAAYQAITPLPGTNALRFNHGCSETDAWASLLFSRLASAETARTHYASEFASAGWRPATGPSNGDDFYCKGDLRAQVVIHPTEEPALVTIFSAPLDPTVAENNRSICR
jgi:hypothetical protein